MTNFGTADAIIFFMAHSHLVLLIDDEVRELQYLRAQLRDMPLPPFVYWVPLLSIGSILLNANVYQFDMVIVDISGVTLGDFSSEISKLKCKNLVITSGVMSPIQIKEGQAFVMKEKLAVHLQGFYSKANPSG